MLAVPVAVDMVAASPAFRFDAPHEYHTTQAVSALASVLRDEA